MREMKIYGLHFTNHKGQTTTKTWDDLLEKCRGQVEAYKNKHTTIFGRAKIIHSTIVLQVLYQQNIFKPSPNFFIEHGKIVIPFLFKSTVRRVSTGL